jgi:hypothetical protein
MLAETLSLCPWLLDCQLFSYLDPGAGSVILQVLLATLLGAGWALRMWWGNICSFVSRMLGRAPKPVEPESDQAQSDAQHTERRAA